MLGDAAATGDIHRLLKTKHTAKLIVKNGEIDPEQEAVTLNRGVRYGRKDAHSQKTRKLEPELRQGE